jgi:CRISPR/Cas system CSM-associated protein Csm2 small subunit
MIRDAQGKLAITPGKCQIADGLEKNFIYALNENGINRFWAMVCKQTNGGSKHGECDANAALYAEAHNITNQTGRTPAELRDLVRELREALKAHTWMYRNTIGETEDKIRALLKKSEGV